MKILSYMLCMVTLLSIHASTKCMETGVATYSTIESFIRSASYQDKLPIAGVILTEDCLLKDKNFKKFTFKKNTPYFIKDHIVTGNKIKKGIKTIFNIDNQSITLQTTHVNYQNQFAIENIQVTDIPIQSTQPQALPQPQELSTTSFTTPSPSNHNADNSDQDNGTITTQNKPQSPTNTRKYLLSSTLTTLWISTFFTNNSYLKKIITILKITKFLDHVVPTIIKKVVWYQKKKK